MTIATYSQEKNWTYYDNAQGRDVYYKIYSKNIVWIKDIYKTDEFILKDKIVRKIVTLYKVDCDGERMGALKIMYYDDNGKLLVNDIFEDGYNFVWEDVVAGTFEANNFKILCN